MIRDSQPLLKGFTYFKENIFRFQHKKFSHRNQLGSEQTLPDYQFKILKFGRFFGETENWTPVENPFR